MTRWCEQWIVGIRVLESEEGAFGERKCSELGLWQGYVCW